MTEPLHVNSPLVKLRVSLARIAMQLDLARHIPGYLDDDPSFGYLTYVAIERERGWNSLAAKIITSTEQRERAIDALEDAIDLETEAAVVAEAEAAEVADDVDTPLLLVSTLYETVATALYANAAHPEAVKAFRTAAKVARQLVGVPVRKDTIPTIIRSIVQLMQSPKSDPN